MSAIYHYTDYTSLNGIIRNGELRMYSTRGMNDPEEMAVYIDLFKDYFKETYPEPNKMNLYRIEEWFDQHKRIFESSSYITAFSMEEDDVAQWERYGNRGQGVCIAFDFENLKRIAEYSEMRLQKITYDDGSSEPAFDEKLIEQMTEYMDSQSLPYGYETDNGFFQEIVGQACMYKGGFYKAERECRLALPAPLLERQIKKLRYAERQNEIKEYYPFEWKSAADDLGIPYEEIITKIIIGRKSPQDPDTLKSYMKNTDNEWAVNQIKGSVCPMR